MAARQTIDPNEEADHKRRAEQQAMTLCVTVMSGLGRPGNFFRISAVLLWENRYRVNVQTGPDAASARIAHSFFVTADEKGNVVESTPPITRQY